MDPILFADQVPDHFLCSICLCVVVDPVEHIDCDKVFCKGCLSALHQQNCPNCRGSLQNKTKKMNRVLHDMYEKLAMRCVNEGCVDTFPWTQQSKHEVTCAFIPKVACEHCGVQILPKAKEEHYKICTLFPVACTVPGCGQIVPRNRMCDHNRDNADPHMELMRRHCDQIQNQSNTRIRELERQNRELQDTIRRLQQDQLTMAARRSSNVPVLGREQGGSPLDRSFGDMTTLTNHSEAVFAIVLSPATYRIFSGSRDKTINMYDAISNVCLHTVRGHDGTVTSLAISCQGDRLFSGSGDSTIKIWSTIEPPQCLHTLSGHQNIVTCLALHETEQRLYSGANDNTIRVWNLNALISRDTPHVTLYGHSNWVRALVLSPLRRRLYSASDDQSIKVWDIDTNACIHTWNEHTNAVYALILSEDEDRLFSGSGDHMIKIWDTTSLQCIAMLAGHVHYVMSFALAPEHNCLFSGSGDGMIKMWDMNTFECLATIHPHTEAVRGLLWNEVNRTLYSASLDKKINVWRL